MDRQALGPLPADHELTHWEVAADSIVVALAAKGLFSVDELRRNIENLPAPLYERYGYYGRWAAAASAILVAKAAVPVAALGDALWGAPAARAWLPGDTVRVLGEDTRTRWATPHLRVPGYIFGVEGVVERSCGNFKDPELLAFGPLLDGDGGPAPKQTLYRVRFNQNEINHLYDGGPDDTIDVEIYGQWLAEPLGDANPNPNRNTANPSALVRPPPPEAGDNDTHVDGHCHGHAHGDNHNHEHLSRDEVEAAAVEKEGAPQPGERICKALRQLVVDHGILSPTEIREAVEKTETMNERLVGPSIVAKAWSDPDFKVRLLSDASGALMADFGISASNNTAPTVLTFVENTDDVHNVIVCTLCSCYPRSILGLAPSWYKSRSYRARAVREPRNVLANDFGLTLPLATSVRVHDSTADLRYAVLPARPAGTDDLSEAELEQLVSRDAMLGVALCRSPSNPS